MAGYRYAGVLGVTSVLLVFQIVRPDEDWARSIAVVLQGIVLLIVVATSHAGGRVRRTRIAGVVVALAVVLTGVATGVLSDGAADIVSGVLSALVPLALARGLIRLVGERGVTGQAVAGGLAIYVSIGLVFAWAISAVALLDARPYFVQGTDGTPGDRVYYSFTTLSTTGYGDFTPATDTGHAIAVVEMLVGQLYLVTVIGVLAGRLVGRAARR